MKRLVHILGLANKEQRLESKIFNVVLALMCMNLALTIPINFWLGLSGQLNLILLLVMLVCTGLFYFNRFINPNNSLLIHGFLITGIICFIPGWFLSGGLRGTGTISSIFCMALAVMLIDRSKQLLYISVICGVMVLQIVLEKLHPEWVYRYSDSTQMEIDLITSCFIYLIFTALMVGVFKTTYLRDRAELEEKTRLLDITVQNLLEAKHTAETATEDKTRYLAFISHEIRTPLNGIIGAAQLLQHSNLSSQQSELVDTLKASSDMLLEIVTDILDLSRLEADKLDIVEQRVSIQRLVGDVVQICAPRIRASQKNLRLQSSVNPRLPAYVSADGQRVKQVLVNLVNNAIKFTRAGSVDIVVDVEEKGNQRWLRFDVKDTGIGISRDNLKRLFLPFSQTGNARDLHAGGSGLGLSICKRLVELMHGTISAESKEGTGSVFSFTIPLKDAETVSDIQEALPQTYGARNPKVLIADDNPMNQVIAKRVFELIGCTVEAVSDGQQACDRLWAENFDVVLMDVQMPKLNGIEATMLLRTLKGGGEMPYVVGMSAHLSDKEKDACIKAGMADFLAKPFTIEDTNQLLLRWNARVIQ